MDRYHESHRIFAQAKEIIPGGVIKGCVDHVPGRYPIYHKTAKGSRMWDMDGNEYIDWMSGYGCLLLGHRCEEVDNAAKKQIDEGFITILNPSIQNDLAQMLIDVVPSAEMVWFCKSGTDATSAAVRVARIHTGRDIIVRWGYHGWSDWAIVNFYGLDVGVPQATRDQTLTFEYNDIQSLKAVFNENPGQIACVIMMPLEIDEPLDGFLEGVKQLCEENGTVLIFDEVRSSFRMSLGGAQEYYGVIPDLTTMSKSLSNGYAIGAVVGKREIMEAMNKGLFSGTYFVSAFEMAAAVTCLNIIRRDGVIEHLWTIGKKLQQGLREVIARSSLGIEVVGVPPMPFLRFALDDEDKKWIVMREFYAEVARLGVYLHPYHHWFVNFSHTEEDVEHTVEICEKALIVAERAL